MCQSDVVYQVRDNICSRLLHLAHRCERAPAKGDRGQWYDEIPLALSSQRPTTSEPQEHICTMSCFKATGTKFAAKRPHHAIKSCIFSPPAGKRPHQLRPPSPACERHVHSSILEIVHGSTRRSSRLSTSTSSTRTWISIASPAVARMSVT